MVVIETAAENADSLSGNFAVRNYRNPEIPETSVSGNSTARNSAVRKFRTEGRDNDLSRNSEHVFSDGKPTHGG